MLTHVQHAIVKSSAYFNDIHQLFFTPVDVRNDELWWLKRAALY